MFRVSVLAGCRSGKTHLVSAAMNRLPTGERESSTLDASVDLADSLVADYDSVDFLYRVLDHTLPLTNSAAAVLLHSEGRLYLVASPHEDAEDVELLEMQNEQGPAHDAFHTGADIRVDRVADAATIGVLQRRATADVRDSQGAPRRSGEPDQGRAGQGHDHPGAGAGDERCLRRAPTLRPF